jgi:hypothetical protein
MTDEEMLIEIFKIYQPVESRPHPGYRVYYDADTLEILFFSQEDLPYPHCQVTKEVYETYRPDLFAIEDGEVVAIKQVIAAQIQLTKGGDTFFSLPKDIQFAVDKEYTGDKTNWN